MTWSKTVRTDVGITAYHVYEGGSLQGEEKIRISVGASHADLNDEQRRGLAEYLLQGLEG